MSKVKWWRRLEDKIDRDAQDLGRALTRLIDHPVWGNLFTSAVAVMLAFFLLKSVNV
jgi:hypothetical protein